MSHDREAGVDLIVPAYFHPAVAPEQWKLLVRLAPMLRLVVINVHNGPGQDLDPSYPPVLLALQEAGVRLAGYVDSAYGQRAPIEIAHEVTTYRLRYGVQAVFLDQVTMGLDGLEHYAQCVLAARAAGARFVALNPGMHPHPGYLDLANLTVTFEGTWDQYQSLFPPPWITNFPSSRFCHLVHSVSPDAFAEGLRLTAARHARTVLLTDGGGDNPWDRVPAAMIDALMMRQPAGDAR